MLSYISTKAQAGITGFESPAAEYTQLPLSLDQLLIEHPAATYLGSVVGDSMEGRGVFTQDLLIVSRAVTARSGDVIVGTLNGCFVCKVVNVEQRQLISFNPKPSIYQLRPGDEFNVEGVVTRSIRAHHPINLNWQLF